MGSPKWTLSLCAKLDLGSLIRRNIQIHAMTIYHEKLLSTVRGSSFHRQLTATIYYLGHAVRQ